MPCSICLTQKRKLASFYIGQEKLDLTHEIVTQEIRKIRFP